jgi:tetratricopeptide (TPR) repeat protein
MIPPTNSLPADAVREQLQRLLASPVFVTSPSLSRFIAYIVEETLAGRAGQLKEYAIGVSVLGRADAYDPRLDPIVRVQARNLRARLHTHYEGVGAGDPIAIELPKGTYVPTFRWVEERQAPAPETAAPAPGISAPPRAVWRPAALAACLTVLALAAAVWVSWPRRIAPYAPVAVTRNPEVQSLYLRGRYFYGKDSEEGLRRSVSYFERAIKLDPAFAPAHAALSEALNVMVQYGLLPPREGMPRARAAALRALELAPNLAHAHVALGAIHEAYDWDFAAADREFRRAIQLDPGNAAARLWYGLFLRDQGRLDEAVPEIERAHQLDPVSPFTSAAMASIQVRRGKYDAALDLFHSILEVEPLSPSTHLRLAFLYHRTSRVPEAIGALQRVRELAPEDPVLLSVIAASYEGWGMKDQAQRVLAELERLASRKYVSPFELAIAYDAAGDAERAIAYLEKAFEERSSGFAYFAKKKFKTVQSHPRFAILLRKATHPT